MTALLYALRDPNKLRTFLFWYWILTPLVFFIYLLGLTTSSGLDLRAHLNQTPYVALAFLISCMSLLLAGILKLAHTENEGTERTFAIFATAQQLLVGNIPGFLLSYFYARSLWDERGYPFAPRFTWVLIASMAIIGLLSLITVMANINLLLA